MIPDATMTTPHALQPVYATPRPNFPITLHRGRIALEDKTRSRRGPGRIRMALSADTRIDFRLTAPGAPVAPDQWSDDARIQVRAVGASAPMLVANVEWQWKKGSMPTARYSGVIQGGLSSGEPTGLSRAVAHIFNLPVYLGAAVEDPGGRVRAVRAELVGGGWRATIDALPTASDTVSRLRESGGHAITHVLELRREDGAAFDSDSLMDAAGVVGYTLALARGAWTFPHLLVGYSGGHQQVWREWGNRKLDPWDGRLTWWDHRPRDADAALAEVFRGIWPIWQDPGRQSVLRMVIGLLVEASSSIATDARLVLAQAGLELMTWQMLVNEGPSAKLSGNAAKDLRKLLRACHVSDAIPPTLVAAAGDPLLGSPGDGPEFVTWTRNRVAHPPHYGGPGPHGIVSSDAMVGAWRLALNYLHMVVLKWIGYGGSAIDAVDLQTRQVPWIAASSSTGAE